LIHKKVIKLADFGLSKNIEEASKSQSKTIGMAPYIDPKKLNEPSYSLSTKSDVYSVGVLLWEISSGRAPSNNDTSYVQGYREKIVDKTPPDYYKLYLGKYNFNMLLFNIVLIIKKYKLNIYIYHY
jgi:serine/threonine protein kinase